MAQTSNMRNAGRAAENLQAAAHEAKSRAQEMAGDVADRAQRMGTAATEAVRERFDTMRETAADYYRVGRDKARDWEQAMERQVQDRPIVSILGALAIGFAIGFMCRRS